MKIIQRISALGGLIVRYTLDFWAANLMIARQVLSPNLWIKPETIELQTRVTAPLEILTLANLITFTPGTLVLAIEPRGRMMVHVLDGADEAKSSIVTNLENPILTIAGKLDPSSKVFSEK